MSSTSLAFRLSARFMSTWYHRLSFAQLWPVQLFVRFFLRSILAGLLFLLFLASAAAATRYVNVNNPAPMSPYTNWATAATVIQDAVNVARSGDEIVVTNGVYQTGGAEAYGMSNRVSVTTPVTVRSVNGPAVTQIVGYQVPGTTNGLAAVRCVYLAKGAALAGFTLTNGATQEFGSYTTAGGGVWCNGGVVSNCVITGNSGKYGGGAFGDTLNNCTLAGNSASYYGGGAYQSTLNNCTIASNLAHSGGGAYKCMLNNCTITGNSASYNGGGVWSATLNNCTLTGNSAAQGGGAYWSTLNNCIVYYNAARYSGANYADAKLSYCCTAPLPVGAGNLAEEPRLASASYLNSRSPCRGRGSAAYTEGTDVDGEPWANPPSIGCDEAWSGSVTGALSVAVMAPYTNVAVGFGVDFQAVIEGRVSASSWDFGDGIVMSNRPWATHAWAVAGDYVVELRAYNETHQGGLAATVTVHVIQEEHYVAINSTNPQSPYSSWATAATNIHNAVDVATLPGALVLVADGVYQDGARAVYGMSNRVAVTKPVTVRSVNGPVATQIVGYQVPGTTNGLGAVRCVYLTNGAVLAGFTLTNGATQTAADYYNRNRSGGGVWAEGLGAVVSNCVLTGNSAYFSGGGAYSGTLNNCVLTSNFAESGGGAYQAELHNCAFTGNSASYNGGGAYRGTLNNCTLTDNSAGNGGGTYEGTLNNCIVYYNCAHNGSANYRGGTFNYSCTTPLPAGTGNLAQEPELGDAAHLSAGSPCRGRGNATCASGVDVDGESWANSPSIGCDEYWNGSVTGALSVAVVAAYTNVAVGFGAEFQAAIGGRVSASSWDFGDGNVVSNRPWATHAWASAGEYVVALRAYNESYPAGVAATVTVRVVQEEHYVALKSTNPLPPYSSWATAATNIQDAVDAALLPGALVWVSNGVYQTGGQGVYGMSNRVAVTKPLRVRSVNGPAVTQIMGYQMPGTTNGPAAVRCAYLTNGAVLIGFTLTNGATQIPGVGAPYNATNQSGGGLWCEGLSAVLSDCVLTGNSAFSGGGASEGMLNNCTLTGNSTIESGGGAVGGMLNNCVITGNSALYYGGGARQSTLNNCTITGNSARHGGGAYEGTLNNCALTGNSASSYGGGALGAMLNNCVLAGNFAESGGGAYHGTLNNCTVTGNSVAGYGGGVYEATLDNCIIYYNSARDRGTNYEGGTLNYCCTTPLPPGTGNLAQEPELASMSHLSGGSPCRGRGTAVFASGVDVDGEPWANPPSIGCDEHWSGSVMGPLTVTTVAAHTNVSVGFSVDFQAVIGGRVSASRWNFGDGTVVSNRPSATHAWTAPGDFLVELRAYNESYPAGVAAAVTVHVVQEEHYVALSSRNPLPPYSSWATAATNIQDAIEVALLPGAFVWVSNGVHQTGGRAVYGMSNRVAVTTPLTVRSVNGPAVTQIRGYQVPGTTNGPAAVRCVYLTNGAVLAGFTLTNGATQTTGDSYEYAKQSGGGVWCERGSVVVSNCVLAGNSADYGGAAYYGTLNNCFLTGNSARAEGGGAYWSALNNCVLTGNSADYGGGASYSALNNCVIRLSSARFGGGAYRSTLNNCVVTGNSAYSGGGSYIATLSNCIVYYNNSRSSDDNYSGGTFNYCCTTPLPEGTGNLINAPFFVTTNDWRDLRLQPTSPCINAGHNPYARGPTDLDGYPRIAGGRVDIGPYEFQGLGLSGFTAWLWQYGLRVDGSADATDADKDGLNNWQEWQADTDPTSSGSVLRLKSISAGPPVTVEFSGSSPNRLYSLQHASDLSSGSWADVPGQIDVPGTGGSQTLSDTNAAPPRFFRVRVRLP